MNKKLYTTVFAILILNTIAFPQNFEWIRSNAVGYSLNPALSTYSVCTSASGKAYASRLDSMIFYFGNIYGIEKIDCYDSNGQLQWIYEFGQKAIIQRIAADADGNIYAAGSFLDNLLVGGHDSIINTGPSLTTNTFLMSLDSMGTLRWKRNLTTTHPNAERISAIHFDPQGRCWYGFSDFNTTSIIRVDSLGQDDLTRSIQGTRALGGFDFDPQGNLFVSGSTEGGYTLATGGLSVNVNDSYMMYVLRMDAGGTGSWIRLAHDVTFQEPVVVCDPWGGAYLGGGLMDSAVWGNVILEGPQWVYDFFLTNVDSLGNFGWGVEVPHTSGGITGDFQRGDNMFMDVDALGNVYLTGVTRGVVDWGNGVVSGAGAPVYSSVSILSFDQNGTARWSKQGGGYNYHDAYALALNQQGDCYFAAVARDTIMFDTISVNLGGGLAFVLGKISTPLATSIYTSKNEEQFHVYPNPTKDQVTIEFDSPENFFEIQDVTGKLLKKEEVHVRVYELDLRALKSGLYFLTAGDKNRKQHLKIVKE